MSCLCQVYWNPADSKLFCVLLIILLAAASKMDENVYVILNIIRYAWGRCICWATHGCRTSPSVFRMRNQADEQDMHTICRTGLSLAGLQPWCQHSIMEALPCQLLDPATSYITATCFLAQLLPPLPSLHHP